MPSVHIPRKLYDRIRDSGEDFNDFVKEAVREKLEEMEDG